ncbi:hypothetical protein BGX38DRAFT_1174690, partial [Terfezia claveryi]
IPPPTRLESPPTGSLSPQLVLDPSRPRPNNQPTVPLPPPLLLDGPRTTLSQTVPAQAGTGPNPRNVKTPEAISITPTLPLLDGNMSFIDFFNIDLARSFKSSEDTSEDTPWFSQGVGFTMENGEELDLAALDTWQNASTESVCPETAKEPTSASGTKAKGNMNEVSAEPDPQTPKTTLNSDIPTTVERRREPRYASIDPRNLLSVNPESALDHLKRIQATRMQTPAQAGSGASRPPNINLFDSMQRLDTGPFSKHFYRDRDKQDKRNLQHYREIEKQIESLYLWSGSLLGDEHRRHEKFGMCGLDWRETLDFLKAPSVGGRPTVPVSRMVPGGRMSRILVNDLLLQNSVPEADFLGNYCGGSPISLTLSSGGKRITVDRTRLNGCFFFDYRGDVIPVGHQFDRMKPALDFGRKRQIMPLNNERNWQWLLGNFFTLPPSKTQRSGLQSVPSHVQLPVSLAPTQTNHGPIVLTSYRPRQDLLHDIGNLVISVPLNQGRFECAWERLCSIRAKERRGPPGWYLLNCPIHRMRWIKSTAKNIYKPRVPPGPGENKRSGDGTTDTDETITQREAINFSRMLWLDICEELKEARKARVARNRVRNEGPLDSLQKRNHAIDEAIEKSLGKKRSSWDKLATGWATNDERKRLEKDVELGRWVVPTEEETTDKEKNVQGKKSCTSPSDGEGKTLYGTYAWSLFEDQSEAKNSNQSCNLSFSNLEVRPEVPVGITNDEPVPLSINQAGYRIRPVNCYASTPWTNLGGVRELFTTHEDNENLRYGNKEEQEYIVVLALVTDAINGVQAGDTPKSTHHAESKVGQGRPTMPTNGKRAQPSASSARTQRTMSSEEERGTRGVESTPKREQGKPMNGKIFRPSTPLAGMSSTSQQRSMPTIPSKEERAYHEKLSQQHQRQMQLAGGTQADTFNLPQSATHPYRQSFQGFIPDPPPPIWRQNLPDFIPDPPPPIGVPPPPPQPTDVPSELSNLLGSGQYKVVAVYPSNKSCAYCNRVLDLTRQRAPIRCCRTERSGGLASSMSQPSLKGGQFVHTKDTNTHRDGCRCSEPKDFHGLEMCFGHCVFCSDDCQERLDEEEQQLGSVWAKMNGFFETQQEAKANRAILRRYRDNDSDNYSVRAKKEGPPLRISILNWPGGWTEKSSLKRKRDKEEREADVAKEDMRSKMSNVKLGSALGSVDYK